MEDNTEKHIEIGHVIFKRVRITGKTLCRERHDGTRFASVIDGKTVDDPFTILHIEDVETGEKYDFNIRHLTAKSLFLDHLLVDDTLYPLNGNIVEDYSDRPELSKEYEATFRWIPEDAEYQDKNGVWHKYRKCNRYKLEIVLEALTEEERKRIATNKFFEFMQGRSYDVTNATPEDRDLYNELLDTVTKWEDEEKEK